MSEQLVSVDERTELADANKLEILLFSLGTEETFGINVHRVREVRKTPRITKTPNMPKGVEGLVSLRGNVIPVIALTSFLGYRSEPPGSRDFMMVVEYSDQMLGFLIHEVNRIFRTDWDKVCPPEHIPDSMRGMIAATAESDDGTLVALPDVEQILFNAFGKVMVGDLLETAPSRYRRVFFVDDSAIARQKIAQVLDRQGIEYDHASHGAEAWTCLQELAARAERMGSSLCDEVGVILVDAEMPQMNGYSLTKNIKTDERFNGIIVLMHSSLSSEASRIMERSVGVDAHVSKSDPEILVDTLRQLLEHDKRSLE